MTQDKASYLVLELSQQVWTRRCEGKLGLQRVHPLEKGSCSTVCQSVNWRLIFQRLEGVVCVGGDEPCRSTN
jgi:hypothetical protein